MIKLRKLAMGTGLTVERAAVAFRNLNNHQEKYQFDLPNDINIHTIKLELEDVKKH